MMLYTVVIGASFHGERDEEFEAEEDEWEKFFNLSELRDGFNDDDGAFSPLFVASSFPSSAKKDHKFLANSSRAFHASLRLQS